MKCYGAVGTRGLNITRQYVPQIGNNLKLAI